MTKITHTVESIMAKTARDQRNVQIEATGKALRAALAALNAQPAAEPVATTEEVRSAVQQAARSAVQQAALALEDLDGPGYLIGGVMHHRISLLLPMLNKALASLYTTAQPVAECKAGGACRWRGNTSAEFETAHRAAQPAAEPAADLVQRLRDRSVSRWVHATGETPQADGYLADKDCAEAADEIERLRAENALLHERHSFDTKEYARVVAEADAARWRWARQDQTLWEGIHNYGISTPEDADAVADAELNR